MKFISKILIFLISLTALDAGKSMGPVGNIIIRSVYDCKMKMSGNDIVLQASAKNVDDKGTKALFVNMTNKIPLDSSLTYDLDVRKWEDSGWKPQTNHSGKFCDDIAKYLPKLWQKVRAITRPAIPVPCPIEPGRYTVEKFQSESKDVDIPTVFYGRLSVQAVVLKGGKPLFCVKGEADSQAPQK